MTISEDYIKGLSIEEIKNKWGVCRKTIYNHLKKDGFPSDRKMKDYRKLVGKPKEQLVKELIWDVIDSSECSICGFNNPLALQFDHIDPSKKKFAIADALSRPHRFSLIRIQQEINKCRVLCANCHQIRTGRFIKNWRLSYETHKP